MCCLFIFCGLSYCLFCQLFLLIMHKTEKHLCSHGVDVLDVVVGWGRQCYGQRHEAVSSMNKLKWGPGRGMPNEEEGQLYMGCSKETSALRLTSEHRPKESL